MKWPGMSDDPWSEIAASSAVGAINARRVDAGGQWNFFWAKDSDRHCLLLLRHRQFEGEARSLPKLRGIEVTDATPKSDGSHALVIRLLESSQRDIFHRLCLDIISATRVARSETEAVSLTVSRTWRWHHLLRGGSSDLLSAEEQKGLIGELLTLERAFLPSLSVRDALLAWLGPTGAPKDFEVGNICVEAKARRPGAIPEVSISSEFQLEIGSLRKLFLSVVDLSEAANGDAASPTLTEYADRLRDRIATADAGAIELYEARLDSAGFRWEDDYSDQRWLEGPQQFFDVTDGFPRITPDCFPSGVSRVKYAISLIDCQPYLVDLDRVTECILGG